MSLTGLSVMIGKRSQRREEQKKVRHGGKEDGGKRLQGGEPGN